MADTLAKISVHSSLPELEVSSEEELTAALRELAKDRSKPALVTVERRDGDTLAIGLGQPYSVLSYVRADGNPPYYVSVGRVLPSEPVVFYFNDHYSEFAPHHAITLDEALAVMREFANHSCLPLPDAIVWEEG